VSAGSAPRARTRNQNSDLRVVDAAWDDEVRSARIARRRTLTYSTTAERKVFMIDGRVMEEDRVDQTVRARRTEEWNDRQHGPHITASIFIRPAFLAGGQCVRRNEASLRDTFSLPPVPKRAGRIESRNPLHRSGDRRPVRLSLHAVDHEDKGMMGVVEVSADEIPRG